MGTVQRCVWHVCLRLFEDIPYLGDDAGMGILMIILMTLALLVCNLIYCGQRILADLRQSRRANVTLGSFALCGALMATVLMAWATLANLAHL